MKEGNRIFLISSISAGVGGAFGAVSGSSSLLVVGIVGAVIAMLIAAGIRGIVK